MKKHLFIIFFVAVPHLACTMDKPQKDIEQSHPELLSQRWARLWEAKKKQWKDKNLVSIDPQSSEEKIWKPAGQEYDPKKHLSSDMQTLNEDNEKKYSKTINGPLANFEFFKSRDRRRFLNDWLNDAKQKCNNVDEFDDLDWQIQEVERKYDEDAWDQFKIERALFKEILFDRHRSDEQPMSECEAKGEAKQRLKNYHESTSEHSMAREYLLSFKAQHEEAFKKSYSQDNRRLLLEKQRVHLLEMKFPEIKLAQERWNPSAKDLAQERWNASAKDRELQS